MAIKEQAITLFLGYKTDEGFGEVKRSDFNRTSGTDTETRDKELPFCHLTNRDAENAGLSFKKKAIYSISNIVLNIRKCKSSLDYLRKSYSLLCAETKEFEMESLEQYIAL